MRLALRLAWGLAPATLLELLTFGQPVWAGQPATVDWSRIAQCEDLEAAGYSQPSRFRRLDSILDEWPGDFRAQGYPFTGLYPSNEGLLQGGIWPATGGLSAAGYPFTGAFPWIER